MASLAERLFFQLAIRKNWIPLWGRWGGQAGQLTGGHGLVHGLVGTSPLLIMPTVTASHTQTLAGPTLLLLQYRTRKQPWPGLSTSHLMRWRYFIISLFTAKKHAAILTYLLPSKKCTSQCIFLDNVENLSFFLSFLIGFNLLNTRQEHSPCLFKFFYVILFLVKESKIDNDFFVLPVNYYFTGIIKL